MDCEHFFYYPFLLMNIQSLCFQSGVVVCPSDVSNVVWQWSDPEAAAGVSGIRGEEAFTL